MTNAEKEAVKRLADIIAETCKTPKAKRARLGEVYRELTKQLGLPQHSAIVAGSKRS